MKNPIPNTQFPKRISKDPVSANILPEYWPIMSRSESRGTEDAWVEEIWLSLSLLKLNFSAFLEIGDISSSSDDPPSSSSMSISSTEQLFLPVSLSFAELGGSSWQGAKNSYIFCSFPCNPQGIFLEHGLKARFGHLDIRLLAINIAKLGNPTNSFKNVAQRRRP